MASQFVGGPRLLNWRMRLVLLMVVRFGEIIPRAFPGTFSLAFEKGIFQSKGRAFPGFLSFGLYWQRLLWERT